MIDRRKLIIWGGIAIAAPLVAHTAMSQSRSSPPTPDEVYRDPDIPVLGNPDGDVTIVSFFDYNCPFCKGDYPVLKDVARRDGNVRLIKKDRPILTEASRHASRLVLAAAGTPDYEAGMDAIMLEQGRLSIEEIDAALRAAGLDVDVMSSRYDQNSEQVEALFDRNNRQALGLRLTGTPGYAIGRKLVAGSYDAPSFEEAIKLARDSGDRF